jgi:hypothetical protein
VIRSIRERVIDDGGGQDEMGNGREGRIGLMEE